MDDTDLQIVDADPSGPFDLNLEEYSKQLEAGTSRTLPNMSLRDGHADYDSLDPEILANARGKSHGLRDRE